MSTHRIGIIGAGATIGISQQHVRAYASDSRAHIVVVYDVIKANAVKRAEDWKLGAEAVCDTLDELFERVDVVSICTPNSTHAGLIERVLAAGKHLLCEKPLAQSYEEAERSVANAKAHPGLVAMIGFNYRDIPAVRYMKELIDAGKLGRIFTCRVQMGGSRIADPTGVKLEWRMQRDLSGAGALADFGCHVIDLADHLLAPTQGRLAQVHAFAETHIARRTLIGGSETGEVTNDDAAAFSARTSGGTLVSALVSRVGMPRFMIEIVGEGGMVVYSGKPDEIEQWRKPPAGPYPPGGRETIAVPERFTGREEHKGLVQELLTAVETGAGCQRGLEYGLYIQGVLRAMEQSAQTGQAVSLESAEGREPGAGR